ncbi:MAG TPA: hypothetical protein VMH22_05965 [bacterium]|nr:hypothetical protein [bacterium]
MLSAVLVLSLLRADTQLLSSDQKLAQGPGFHVYASVSDGLAYSVPLPIIIRQSGQPDIKLTAHFSTRPFADVPYYDAKVGIARGPWAYELELIHHKLYLDHPPPDVQSFEITHGYNPILVNAVREQWRVRFRAGAGILLAHPETTIRGLPLPENGGILGWYVSGPAAQVSVSKYLGFGHHFFAGLEGKFVGAWARVPVADGSADVPNLSVHGLVSVGWRF